MVYLLMYLCFKVDTDKVSCQLTYLLFSKVSYKLSLLFTLITVLLRCVVSYLVFRIVLRSIIQPELQPVAVAKFFQDQNIKLKVFQRGFRFTGSQSLLSKFWCEKSTMSGGGKFKNNTIQNN